jgi:heme-degrading monooxygenase HmoA
VTSPETEFVAIWEFRVADGSASRFEQLHGTDGAWVRLFGRGAGYLGSELLRDVDHPGRYVTIDRWTSEDAYRAFRLGFDAEYRTLDEEGELLTDGEQPLGSFVRLPR